MTTKQQGIELITRALAAGWTRTVEADRWTVSVFLHSQRNPDNFGRWGIIAVHFRRADGDTTIHSSHSDHSMLEFDRGIDPAIKTLNAYTWRKE